jgi:hypothetical protein
MTTAITPSRLRYPLCLALALATSVLAQQTNDSDGGATIDGDNGSHNLTWEIAIIVVLGKHSPLLASESEKKKN